ncbi:immunoglobulin domain-containing protein, partial [Chitinophaga sp. RAB17]|uniref:immunoglobulin domain-containing protein n=1 Tax=Chitinophaga sp. RAB17 TaxID=3233049 RepID=UPI003F8E94D6
MKRLLTFLFLLLGLVLLNKQASARQNPSTGDWFMNLPDSACWKSFASTNVFFWKVSQIPDSVDWTITGGSYNILYASQRNPDLSPKLLGQKPEAPSNKNALTIQFLDKGQYTIKAVGYVNGVKTTVSKSIYVKDCSMATCLGQNTGVGDFLENFGTFPTGAANSVSNASVPPSPTGYNYVTYTNGSGSNPNFADNSYTVFWHTQIRSEWVKAYDHTPNTNPARVGGMLLANSAVEKKTFFVKKAVPVCPGSMYNFSAWFMNVNSKEVFNSTCASGNVDGYHYAGVTFQITDDATGTVLAKFKTYDVSMNLDAPTWQEYGGAFKTPANVTNVTLSILNDKLGDCGNDIAIDDISFKYCSPYIYSFIDGQSKPPLRADSLCEGAPVTIKAVYSPLDYFTNPTYQWQYTKDTLNWPAVSVFPAGVTGINTDVLTFPVGTLKGDPNQIVDYYFRVNILEKDNPSNCASPSLYTKISVLPKPKVTISSGRICIGDSVILTANGGYSTYEWQTLPIIKGPKMTAYPLVNTTFAAIGIADYGWNSVTKSPRQCRDTGYANVIVDLKPTIDMTATPTDICLGKTINLTQTHAGAPADSISWRWQYNGTNIGNLSDVSLNHTPPAVGTQQYTIALNNHTCNAYDTVSVNVRSVPNADVDTIYRQCNIPDFTIKRSTPPVDQQGTWMFDGPHKLEVITNTTNPQTTVTGVQPGDTVHLFWVITNKALAACTDTNRVTLINTKPLTPSNAGRDSVQCGITTFQLNATKPGVGEKGKWTLGAGTTAADVSLNYDTAYNAIATILGATRPKTVQLVWSISNGVCAGASSSIIKLTVKNPPTVKVTAAPVCNTVTTFTVSYNSQTGTILNYILDVNPAALASRKMPNFTKITGAWPAATPAGSFTVPLPAGTPAGNYDFVLSAREDSLNGCNTTVYFSLSVEEPSKAPASVTASVDSICVSGSTTLTVVGGSLGKDSTGKAATWKWYTGACPGDPGSKRVYPASSNADSSVVTFNNVTATTTYFVMAPSTGPCASTTCASVTVKVFAQPNKANANVDQRACERTTDFLLNGNTTGVPGVNGLWTTWNSNAIITNPTLPNATVKVNIGDTATLFWTIANGPCLTTTDTMFITNFKKPVAATAGTDQKHCNDSIFTMAANKPTEYGAYGAWTVVGKPTWATITDTTLNTTKVKVLAGHTATLVWTITNGTCAATTDTVLLTNYDVPAVAKANVDQLHCNDSIFTMAANKPTEYGAYGAWTVVGKPTWATITDTTLNNTKVKVLAGHTATLVWTIANGTCAATTDTVLLTNYDVPAVAKANVDQLHCNDSIFTMAANKPTEYGANGTWTVVGKPTWATITDTTLNTTKVKVLAGHTATLVWTISNGTCAATTDTVLLTNYDVPAVAKANVNQIHCNDSIFTMAANKPTEFGAYGAWTVRVDS